MWLLNTFKLTFYFSQVYYFLPLSSFYPIYYPSLYLIQFSTYDVPSHFLHILPLPPSLCLLFARICINDLLGVSLSFLLSLLGPTLLPFTTPSSLNSISHLTNSPNAYIPSTDYHAVGGPTPSFSPGYPCWACHIRIHSNSSSSNRTHIDKQTASNLEFSASKAVKRHKYGHLPSFFTRKLPIKTPLLYVDH